MCYHTRTPKKSALGSYAMNKDLKFDPINYRQYFHVSGFQHPELPVISDGEIKMMQWGLIPFWVKDSEKAKQMQNRTLNAVGETIFERNSYKGVIMKNRGVVLVEGFYEWREFEGKKYPYYLTAEPLVELGCVFSFWIDPETGEAKDTFSIVTTPANELMAQVHNKKKRMPLVLENKDAWLDPGATKEDLQQIMQPSGVDLTYWTVSRRLNYFQRQDTNTPDITLPETYPELPPL